MSKHLDIHALWEKFEQEVSREHSRGQLGTLDLTIVESAPEVSVPEEAKVDDICGHSIKLTSKVIQGIRCEVPQFITRKQNGWVCERIRKGDPDIRFEVDDIEGSDISYSLGITYLKLQYHLKSIPVRELSQLRLHDCKTGAQKTWVGGVSFNWVLNKQRFVYEARFMVSGIDPEGKSEVKTFHVGTEANLDQTRLDRAFRDAREYREISLRRDVEVNGKSLEINTKGRRGKIEYDMEKAIKLLAVQRKKDSARKEQLVDNWLPLDLTEQPKFRSFRGWKMTWSTIVVDGKRYYVPSFIERLHDQWYVYLPEKEGGGLESMEDDNGSPGEALRKCLLQVLVYWFELGWPDARKRLFTAGHVNVDWFMAQAPAWFSDLAAGSRAAAYFEKADADDLRWLCLPNRDLLQRRPVYYVASGDDLSAFERITQEIWQKDTVRS
jgi:hypothetical protein